MNCHVLLYHTVSLKFKYLTLLKGHFIYTQLPQLLIDWVVLEPWNSN